jgi:hypothetical protein
LDLSDLDLDVSGMISPVGACLGHEDFHLTIVEVEAKHATLDGWAVGGVENVTQNLTLCEAGVGDISVDLTVDLVGNTDEELSTSEGVDLVIGPLLGEVVVLDALWMSSSVDCLSKFEHVWGAVKVAPKYLAIIGVITSSESLLTSVVEEGDTSCAKCKSQGTLEESNVTISVEESSVIMVINKYAEGIDVWEVLAVGVPSVPDVFHRLSVLEDISNSKVHGIVEEASDVFLVVSNVGIIAVETFTHLEDTSWLAILRPEVLWDLRNGVDTDTVETILFDEILDPALEVSTDIRIILVKIRKTSKTAVLDLPLVVPIIDVTIAMVMWLLI